MSFPFGGVCDEFQISTRLFLKLDLTLERETVLHFFDSVKREFPQMRKLRRREDEALILEEDYSEEGERRWLRLDFLAYIIPLFALFAGTAAGHLLGEYLSVSNLDAITGFSTLLVTSFFSFRQLRRLNDNHMMVVKRIITDYVFSGEVKSEEERWYPKYSDQY